MKRIVAFIMVFTCVMLIGGVVKSGSETPTSPVDLKILDVKAWDIIVYKLVPAPTEEGNAAKYLLDAIHGKMYDGTEDKKKDTLDKIYPWWDKVAKDFWLSDKPEINGITKDAIKIPELEIFIKSSRQKNYQLMGIYIMPSPLPEKTTFETPIIAYADVMRLSHVMMARAFDKADKGDAAGAEADMVAVIRVGHIFQKDVAQIGFIVGSAIEEIAAKKMPGLYKKIGNEKKAAEWAAVLPKFEKHRESARYVYRYRTIDDIMAIVEDKSLPNSVRVEALIAIIGKSVENSKTVVVTGIPKNIKEFIQKEHFDNPAMIIVQLKIIEDVHVGLLSTYKGRLEMKMVGGPL